MRFDYEKGKVKNLTVPALLKWISEVHSEMTNNGLLPDSVSDQTHNEMMLLAAAADKIKS
jgi:hypothetical protein